MCNTIMLSTCNMYMRTMKRYNSQGAYIVHITVSIKGTNVTC